MRITASPEFSGVMTISYKTELASNTNITIKPGGAFFLTFC